MAEFENQDFEGQNNDSSQTPPPVPQDWERASYGQQQSSANIPPQENYPPNNYMALTISATAVGLLLCLSNCCISMILGIIAIVFSTQVNSKFAMGDYRGAESSSNTAKILGIVSLVLTAVSFIGTIIYYIIFFNSIGGWEGYMEMIQEMIEQNQYR